MAKDLAQIAKQKKIKYFLISFVDLFGVLRSKLVPARAIGGMQKDGAGFAGFAAWLDMTPAHPDMFAIPDPDSLIQLPWQPDVGWLAGDLWMDGKAVEASPRAWGPTGRGTQICTPSPSRYRLPARQHNIQTHSSSRQTACLLCPSVLPTARFHKP